MNPPPGLIAVPLSKECFLLLTPMEYVEHPSPGASGPLALTAAKSRRRRTEGQAVRDRRVRELLEAAVRILTRGDEP